MVRFGNAARGPGEFGRQWVKVKNHFFSRPCVIPLWNKSTIHYCMNTCMHQIQITFCKIHANHCTPQVDSISTTP